MCGSLLLHLPPNPAAAAGTVAGAAAGPLLSCAHPVRVRRNTAPGGTDLEQIVRLRRLRWHRDQTVPVQLFHLLQLLGERFLEALFFRLESVDHKRDRPLLEYVPARREKCILCGRKLISVSSGFFLASFVVIVEGSTTIVLLCVCVSAGIQALVLVLVGRLFSLC